MHLYVGCDGGSGTGANHFSAPLGGASFPSASELFASQELLARYDLVLLGCEGASCGSEKDPYLANLQRYADGGGLLFLNHHQSYWLRNGSPEWRATAQFRDMPENPVGVDSATIDRNFYKGQALSEWLINVGASTSLGEITFPPDRITPTFCFSSLSFVSRSAQAANAPVGSTTIFILSHSQNIARRSSSSVTVSMSFT